MNIGTRQLGRTATMLRGARFKILSPNGGNTLVRLLMTTILVASSGAALGQEPPIMVNQCEQNPPLENSTATGGWAGWGPSANNARFQASGAAGLSRSDVPKLELKWAFAANGSTIMESQPTVAMGRVFVDGGNDVVYSLNARTGCTYWSYKTDARGRFAPIVAPIEGHSGIHHAVFFTTEPGTVYALDAHDGKVIWKLSLKNDKGLFRVHNSTTWYAGRLYIPLTGTETRTGARAGYECCRSRGGVAAVDANTGHLIWQVSTIPEPLRQVDTTADGKPVWGPSGASVWNAPTVDPKRGVIYVGTGNNYGPDPSSTSDSVLALSMKDGHIVWHHQEFSDDSFMAGCPGVNTEGKKKCPPKRGPDWDFGGSSTILQTLPNGHDILVAGGKGGIAIALDPDQRGKLLWRTVLYQGDPPPAFGLVLFGGTADGKRVYYPLQQRGGGIVSLKLQDGSIAWRADVHADRRGQSAAASSIPDVVFSGGWDGVLRAVDSATGEVIWTYNVIRNYAAVNKQKGHGGSIGVAGPAIADGMLYLSTGYVGIQGGTPGNVLLAFGLP